MYQVMHFADYSGAELLQIAMDMLAAKGFKLDGDAQGRLKAMCDKTASAHDTQASSQPRIRAGAGLTPCQIRSASPPGSPPPDLRCWVLCARHRCSCRAATRGTCATCWSKR